MVTRNKWIFECVEKEMDGWINDRWGYHVSCDAQAFLHRPAADKHTRTLNSIHAHASFASLDL